MISLLSVFAIVGVETTNMRMAAPHILLFMQVKSRLPSSEPILRPETHRENLKTHDTRLISPATLQHNVRDSKGDETTRSGNRRKVFAPKNQCWCSQCTFPQRKLNTPWLVACGVLPSHCTTNLPAHVARTLF
jgi:hypothetical protein